MKFNYKQIEIFIREDEIEKKAILNNIKEVFKRASFEEIKIFIKLWHIARKQGIGVCAHKMISLHGSYYYEDKIIELSFSFFTNRDKSLSFINHVFSHELGHVFDKKDYKRGKRGYLDRELNAWKVGLEFIKDELGFKKDLYIKQVRSHLVEDIIEEELLDIKNMEKVNVFLSF